MIPTQLNEIAKFLKTNPYNLSQPLHCKLGIYDALCGLLPTFNNEIAWEKYFQKLHKDLGKNTDRDYYFLIINKNDPKDIFINSLKGIQTLQPNGNNLPFQCKWDNNREIIQRDFDGSKNFILSALAESVKLRSSIYLKFKEFFGEFFESIRY
ncbi:hypothetical protein KVL36_04605 [Helicobacter pylori]|nr:hypothetical protein KVL36_04605 [Helicobacter pylori]